MKRVIIIGGGLSGLATARALVDATRQRPVELDLVLLERDPVLGGKIRSIREQDFLCESGPQGFSDNKPVTLALARHLGFGGSLLKSEATARKRYLCSGGHLRVLPEGPGPFFLSDLLSIGGRLRVLAEALIAQNDAAEDESVSAFVRRRLGTEVLDKVIEPMTASVYAGDPDVLSAQSCFPMVVQLERQFGGMLKGMAALQGISASRKLEGDNAMAAEPGGTMWSFEKGTATLIEALAESLSEYRILTQASVQSLERLAEGWRVVISGGEILDADVAVLATPAYEAAALLRSVNAELSDLLYTIPYTPAAVVCMGYRSEDVRHPLDGAGFITSRSEGKLILTSRWDSHVFAERAPDGMTLLSNIVAGARNPGLVDCDDQELARMVHEELAPLVAAQALPVYTKIYRWPKAIPQYILGHASRVRKIEQSVEKLGGLFLSGDAYHGIGLNNCTAQSVIVASRVADYLVAPQSEGMAHS